MNRIPIDQVILVEGKYDKITLDSIVDATVIAVDGFGIFKNEAKKKALRTMAQQRGVIILTDSDSAGGLLRSYLQTILQGCEIYTLYVPAVPGKEKRKTSYSKEGFLGVEGTDPQVLRNLFSGFQAAPVPVTLTATDLYEYGLTGVPGASERKLALLMALGLPPHLSNNALLKELNRRFDPHSFSLFLKDLK